MKKTIKLFLSLIVMTIVFFAYNGSTNATDVAEQVKVTGATMIQNPNGHYSIFTVEPSGGTHAYCLDASSTAPSVGMAFKKFDLASLLNYNQINKMVAVLRTSGDPNYTFGLGETDSFYVTQAALWYAEYGGTGVAPLTQEFHDYLKGNATYGPAYNKLLAVIDEANNGKDFTKENVSISIGASNELTNAMHEVTIDGNKYLLSDSVFKVNAPGAYTVNVEGGYVADANGNNTGKTSASFGVNDTFRIIVPVASEGEGSVSATFSVTTNQSYVLGYSLEGYVSTSMTTGVQRLALLYSKEGTLSTSYSVNGNYENEITTDIKIAKVNGEGKLISGAKLGIYKETINGNSNGNYGVYLDEELVGSYNSTSEYITVTLGKGKYSLKEISAPKGYISTDKAVSFEIDEKGNLKDSNGNVVENKTLTVVNELPTIKIRKINEAKKDVKNVKIVICDYNAETKEESNCNFEWITDGTTKELTIGVDFGSIKDGSYIIKEVSAPHGYELSAPKTITVKDGKLTGDLQDDTVVFINKAYIEVSKTDATGQDEIPGANMELFDQNGVSKKTWTSTTESEKISGLIPGEVYTLVETLAPEGYVKLTTSIYFTISDQGKVVTLDCQAAGNNKVDASSCKVMSEDDILKIKNDIIEIEISKIDVTEGKEQAGAKLQILNMDNSPVYQDGQILEWVTGAEKDEDGNPIPHRIKMLPAGKYKIVETYTPEGYVAVRDEVEFEVQEVSGIQKFVFENQRKPETPNGGGVVISKKDFTTGKEIEGAHLSILDENGNVVVQNGQELSWISGTEEKQFEMLPEGKYVLVESVPADGYKGDMIIDGMVTSKYNFEVVNGKITRIDVYNEILTEVPVTGMNVSSTYIAGSFVVLAGLGTITYARKKEEM